MQWNGAAPVFSFLLCFGGGRVCGLTEVIHNPCSASPRGPVDLVRGHVTQRLVSAFRGGTHEGVRQVLRSFSPHGVASQRDVFVRAAPPEPFQAEPVIQGIRHMSCQHVARGPVEPGHHHASKHGWIAPCAAGDRVPDLAKVRPDHAAAVNWRPV